MEHNYIQNTFSISNNHQIQNPKPQSKTIEIKRPSSKRKINPKNQVEYTIEKYGYLKNYGEKIITFKPKSTLQIEKNSIIQIQKPQLNKGDIESKKNSSHKSHLYFNDYNHYSFTLGLLNLFLEMLCSLPQIIEMYKTKNQKNISKIMVLLWLLGNSIKVYYNIYNKSPIQLIIGAYIQVFFNIILILQIIYYYFMNNSDKEGMLINNSNKLTFDNNSQNDEDIKENNK